VDSLTFCCWSLDDSRSSFGTAGARWRPDKRPYIVSIPLIKSLNATTFSSPGKTGSASIIQGPRQRLLGHVSLICIAIVQCAANLSVEPPRNFQFLAGKSGKEIALVAIFFTNSCHPTLHLSLRSTTITTASWLPDSRGLGRQTRQGLKYDSSESVPRHLTCLTVSVRKVCHETFDNSRFDTSFPGNFQISSVIAFHQFLPADSSGISFM
jgi:hypothetical protein